MAEANPIRVDDRAKEIVERESKKRQLDQKVVASKVLHWFGEADEVVRAAILDQIDPAKVQGFHEILLSSFNLKR